MMREDLNSRKGKDRENAILWGRLFSSFIEPAIIADLP